MSTTPQQVERKQIPEPKTPERVKVSRDAEIELIKRQLSQLIHRVEGLKSQKA